MKASARSPVSFVPAYARLLETGELGRRVDAAWRHLEDCDLCARYCHVNRRAGIEGAVCRTGERASVASWGAHHGEEDCLRGWRGSGTIFFSWCNLRCVFCQNWDISQKGIGREVEPDALADMMLELQGNGCHNINLVSPSHVVAQIIAALANAAARGLRLPLVYNTGGYDSLEALRLPLVYNTGGYDSLEALRLLDGIVDIYMPDMKYGDSALARKYSKVRDYVAANRSAVKEMHRQVGDLVLDEHGIAQRGLLVRHLVLPGGIAGTEEVLAYLAAEVSRDTYVNLMDQYRPCYRADEYPELGRPVSVTEYDAALAAAARHGITRLDARAPRRRTL